MRVLRFHWFDPEPDERQVPVDWRSAALITATLFLNFAFSQDYGLDLWGFGPLLVDASVVGAAALLVTGLFFIGPALAAQAARQSVFGSIENSLGSIPTFVLRLCCVLFLSVWIAKLVAVPTLWALTRNLEPELTSNEIGMIAAGILAFLFFTGLQSTRTSAKLALFTNELGIAILIAAFLRVHDGWASVPAGFPTAGQGPAIPRLCHSLSSLTSYAAPLGAPCRRPCLPNPETEADCAGWPDRSSSTPVSSAFPIRCSGRCY